MKNPSSTALTSYERRPMKAPTLSGRPLELFTRLVEQPVLGGPLRAQLLRQAGVADLRAADAQASPLMPPLHRDARDPERAVTPPVALAQAAAELPSRASGFRFPTVADFAEAYRDGRVSPVDVAERVLAATAATDASERPLRVFIAQVADDLRAQARASAARHAEGAPLSVLDGVPVAVKDEVDQVPYPTTAGTRFLTTPAPADSEVVARLRAAGALLIGKANMHELGLGVTGMNPHHGVCRNPYDPGRHTGGSSSGSAAAVAAGLCPLAIGADGGGSIRIPAAFCGVVGLKPTFGRVSERGATPLCWSVAHLGPIAATARDAAIGYALLAGVDPGDPGTALQPAPHLQGVGDGDLSGLTLGVFRPWFEDARPEVVRACEDTLRGLEQAGARIREIEIEGIEQLRLAHLVTIASEMVAAQIPNDPEHRADFGLDVRLNFAVAREFAAMDYVHAQRHRAQGYDAFLRVLQDVDVVVTPTSACPPPPIAEHARPTGESNLQLLSEIMRFAPQANLTGLPGISFPAGYTGDGLPVGLQLMGRPWDEATLLRIALAAEAFVARARPQVWEPVLG